MFRARPVDFGGRIQIYKYEFNAWLLQRAAPAYELGPGLLAAQKLPGGPVAGMAFGGEGGPDPSKFDFLVGDDFGVWQNKSMESSSVTVEQSGIPG